MVALEFACSYPQMVNTLTLAVTNAGLTVPPLRGMFDMLRCTFASSLISRHKLTCGMIFPDPFLRSPSPEGSNCKTMLDFCVQRYIRWEMYTHPISFLPFLSQVGAVIRHHVSSTRLETLGKTLPNKQILIITGDQDHLVRISNSFYIAKKVGHKNVRFEQIEHAGHGVMTQYPERVSQCINTMIGEVTKNRLPTVGDH
ncbi:hypothetical protein DL89DRAFT_270772 [Linderina pennispora]|uniref:Alpha/beta-hydrolase n=1 Tax=Linderina pennispora TaxID=61395 RepID=A0A1Y1VXE8_9FUNG|nr:uncharacterized protein DL89DRAFT_270772 [Linderina pennispora]ORX65705.1 hypothetical protein DL89DRAFT_270772 [Linderina pennispora]